MVAKYYGIECRTIFSTEGSFGLALFDHLREQRERARSKVGHACRSVRSKKRLDDRQITHLICVRLKELQYDFLGGVLGLYIYI